MGSRSARATVGATKRGHVLMTRWLAFAAIAALVGAAPVAPALGQDAGQPAKVSKPGQYSGYATVLYDGYQRTSFYVPMRDGTKLAVDLFRPTKGGVVANEKLPVVWMHTPYNRRPPGKPSPAAVYPGFALELVKYGYNVAVVDFRGLYASYGKNYGYNAGEWFGPATNDAYDTTEWFAKQPWSSGRIGMWGCSATGGSQVQALTVLPPHLNAIMPMSPVFDSYTFGVLGGVAPPGPVIGTGHPVAGEALNPNAARDKEAAPVDGPNGPAELAAAIATHIDNTDTVGVVPYRDSPSAPLHGVKWWEQSGPSMNTAPLRRGGIGVYATATWDEYATKPAAFFLYANLPPSRAKLLVGPETHCAWKGVNEDYGFSIVTEELRFFDYWLKGVKNGIMDEAPVTYFTYNAPKESAWRTAKTWPLPNEVRTRFYLADGQLLQGASPAKAAGDAAAMVPPPPDRIVDSLPQAGNLAYETAPLDRDTEITGHPTMNLWIKTSAGDADVFARILDVAPDGTRRTYQMIGRLRASGRALAKAPYNNLGLPWHSFYAAAAKPVPIGKPTELQFDFLPMSYIFPAGHRIRLELSFSDPKRRPGTAAEVTVLRGAANASELTLPVIPGA
jgi:putative CocE/NonD family hydrolase